MWALSLGYQSCELSFSGTSEVLTRTISMVFKGAATHRLAGSAAPGVRRSRCAWSAPQSITNEAVTKTHQQ
jgi:hypothetical protein